MNESNEKLFCPYACNILAINTEKAENKTASEAIKLIVCNVEGNKHININVFFPKGIVFNA